MSTTPLPTGSQGKRSLSQSRRAQSPPQRPTTPLRPPSRSSLRSSYNTPSHGNGQPQDSPIATLEPAFAEFSDSMADLEANFMHLQIMHESLARFSDCFASFLYGLNVNAWCVDFPEAPTAESFRRAQDNPAFAQNNSHDAPLYPDRLSTLDHNQDIDQTFLTSDTSFFVDNPPPQAARAPDTRASTANGRTPRGSTRGRAPLGQRGGRPSRLATASTRGRRGGGTSA